MFCANCTSDKGPFRREVQDGRAYVFCVKCLEAPAHLYDGASFGAATHIGASGVGVGNRHRAAYSGGA